MFKIKDIWSMLDSSRKNGAAPDMAELQATLAQTIQTREEAKHKLAWIANRREGLLLTDQDAILDQDALEQEKAFRVVEKCDAAVPAIERRLQELRDSNRQALIAEWRGRIVENFEANKEAFEALVATWQEDQSLRREFEAAHIGELRFHDSVFQGMDLQGALANWLAHSKMVLSLGEYAERQPKPSAAPTPPPKPLNGTKSARGEPLANYSPPPPRSKKPPRREPIIEAAKDGEMLVTVLRDGVEHEKHGRLYIGDVLAVPSARAAAMMRSGGFDLVAGTTETSR